MSGADIFPTAGCDAYGELRKTPALSPAELKIDGAFSSPLVRESASTPFIVTPGGRPMSNACHGKGRTGAKELRGLSLAFQASEGDVTERDSYHPESCLIQQ